MMLVEAAPVADAALPVEEFKAHLRLGSGFGTENLQDAVLRGFLRAAMTAIEGRIGKALIARTFRLSVSHWARAEAHVLPVAPVRSIDELILVDAEAQESLVSSAVYRLDADAAEPRIRSTVGALPAVPENGSAHVVFVAGYGLDWAEIPADLAQAVLMLAAHYYEFRNETDRSVATVPFGVVSLIARYRVLRLTSGGAA